MDESYIQDGLTQTYYKGSFISDNNISVSQIIDKTKVNLDQEEEDD